jgi:hypothetical protein
MLAMLLLAVPVGAQVCGDGIVDPLEQCDGGVCCTVGCTFTPLTLECRPSLGPCDVTETCDGVSALCPADLLQPDGTVCDDANACTSSDACRAGSCEGVTTPDACADDALCYRVRAEPSEVDLPSFFHLVDRFQTRDYELLKVKHLCAPTDKGDAEGLLDPATHLESYQLRLVPGSAQPLRQEGLRITNRIGRIFVTTDRAELLLVPTATDSSVVPVPPDPATHDVNHYVCYRARVTAGTPRFDRGLTVSVDDGFTGTTKTFSLVKPRLLCIPVEANGAAIQHPEANLLCYQVKGGRPRHEPEVVHLNNEVGPTVVRTVKDRDLCVPSVVEVVPTSPSGAFLDDEPSPLG